MHIHEKRENSKWKQTYSRLVQQGLMKFHNKVSADVNIKVGHKLSFIRDLYTQRYKMGSLAQLSLRQNKSCWMNNYNGQSVSLMMKTGTDYEEAVS